MWKSQTTQQIIPENSSAFSKAMRFRSGGCENIQKDAAVAVVQRMLEMVTKFWSF
jgi:hypothetical protein